MRFSHVVIYKLFFDTPKKKKKKPTKKTQTSSFEGKKIPNLKVEGGEWDTKNVTVQWNKEKSR